MNTHDIVVGLCENHNMNKTQLEKELGLGQGSIGKWKESTPKASTLKKVADYFGVSLEYLTSGKEEAKTSKDGQEYYFSDETAEMAQELFENKDMRILFDAAKDSSPEDLQMAASMLQRMKATNPNG